ncbi:tRNA lysidine(34) synthetase TilS [Candidatus Puniceispirillum marinum]|uniref:tRNA(Ile)-lysidine synthase n=1 Tax=Puniceispirillum marinum (strain IMCC1322) TaxID=488538 RepID=D5BPP3_PUNMI|nr:tRNA lysidine(34) synthetase TilS [Candidatus Puniceispirillum marinum]ADE40545.1 Predicted ATPase of the PP-loop superfamily implicated in cell cycle control [Candidatus Puniceispirillum marinum IMCC1322]
MRGFTADALTRLDTEFAAAMSAAGLDQHISFVSALSGGADSTALCLLMSRFAVASGKAHRAIIVDHGIRENAGAEAARVAARMQKFGINVKIEKVSDKAPETGIQAWARRQRFEIMLAHARRDNAALLVGHHAGDQAETIAMRLGKDSGLVGLAGMKRTSWRAGVPIGRPLLDWPADRMADICRIFACEFEDDPSNLDRRFERIRLRQFMMQDKAYGAKLCRLGDAARQLLAMLDQTLADSLARDIRLDAAGYARLPDYRTDTKHDATTYLADMPEIAWHRAMGRLLHQVGGQTYAPSYEALCRLRTRMQRGLSSTLSACLVTPAGNTDYLVVREVGRTLQEQPVETDLDAIFAGCWHVTSKIPGKVLAFGHTKLAQTPSRAALPPEWDVIPHIIRQSIPVIQSLDEEVFYPQIMDSTNNHNALDAPANARFLPLAPGQALQPM